VGLGYLLLLLAYLYVSAHWARQHPEEAVEAVDVAAHGRNRAPSVGVTLFGLVIGLAVVVVSSDVLVGSVEMICERHHVPQAVIAVTLVALGTSLPELATGIAALVKKHEELTIGNIIGADILNVLFVTGASSAASPLKVDSPFFYLYLPTMMVVLVLFRLYVLFGRDRFHRWQGIPLLAVYVLFLLLTARSAMPR